MSLLHTAAPSFELPDQTGQVHSLSNYAGSFVLLYFYPKDMTPGCTKEACSFRDVMKELNELNVHVFGVSADSVEKHKKFVEKQSLNFPLLSDEQKTVIQAYGVWKLKKFMGKEYMGISRESFLIDPSGKIVKHYEKVKPTEHAMQVIQDITEMNM